MPGMQMLIEEKTVGECRLTVSDLVLGAFGMEEIIKVSGIGNFAIIPFGSFPPNPTELLASPSMRRILRELEATHDVVILDSPPVAPVIDPVLLARESSSVIVVYRSYRAPREVLTSSLRRLEETGTPVVGLVLNCWQTPPSGAI